jgi:DNA-binding LytR/AlgR family response regulator
METQFKSNATTANQYAVGAPKDRVADYMPNPFPAEDIVKTLEKMDAFKLLFEENRSLNLDGLLTKLAAPVAKTSFLVFKNNRYVTVPTDTIAFFNVKYESSVITCFGKQEYFVNHSLEHIQNLVGEKQFFRLNRQYLINFNAIKEVEHYFARKLLVNPVIPVKDKLIVSREKVTEFLNWLEDR